MRNSTVSLSIRSRWCSSCINSLAAMYCLHSWAFTNDGSHSFAICYKKWSIPPGIAIVNQHHGNSNKNLGKRMGSITAYSLYTILLHEPQISGAPWLKSATHQCNKACNNYSDSTNTQTAAVLVQGDTSPSYHGMVPKACTTQTRVW